MKDKDIMVTNRVCYCVGPQNGEPLCLCNMKSQGVIKKGKKWIIPEQEIGIEVLLVA